MRKLHSCLYECKVSHARVGPARNAFTYSTFLFRLDLDELEHISGESRVFGHERARFFSLRDRDHFKYMEHLPGETPRSRVEKEMKVAGLNFPAKRIELLTACRVLGYVFNPVSFYYIYDDESPEARPRAVLAEVNNTFGEQKPYWVSRGSDGLTGRARKDFYVSPFIDHDVDFTFDLRDPGEDLFVRIGSKRGDEPELIAVLKGKRRELTDANMLSTALRHPLSTIFVIFRIHYQALKLFIKKVPWFGKEDMDERIRAGAKPEPAQQENRSMETA